MKLWVFRSAGRHIGSHPVGYCPSVVNDEHKVGGRSSQTRGPKTAKLRYPYVIVPVLGTTRCPRVAERRQRRPVLTATRQVFAHGMVKGQMVFP